ncbi:hypothetical protein ASG31_17615 [Chryseobacterium sp. Leaf404]|uniref:site-specific integrase n=1 Tax=unclassified Chryseobacterium TaxID=2593645 RepID=UPI000700730C|nr:MULTISPECIES: site-specific integrase [unclassified Chryseobacterium]KQT20247.1 hypothetical protein ASG31_17615 [Chryseobacterium sp. Leaf404]
MALSFFLRGTKDVKKIYASVSYLQHSIKIIRPTPFSVDVENWNQEEKRMILSKSEKALPRYDTNKKIKENKISDFNTKFIEYEDSLLDYLDQLKKEDSLTETKINQFFDADKERKNTPTDFKGFVDYYCEMNIGIKDGTKKVYKRTRNLVMAFNPKFRIQDIDDRFKKDFGNFLDHNNYQRSYIRKTLSNIRDFWKYAKRKKIKVSDDPEWWELSKDFPDINTNDPDDPYLTWNEIELLKNIDLHTDYLDNARDWLLISCWTAQRVSDLMKFNFEKVVTDSSGEKYLKITQEKTSKEVTIPLFAEVERILNKRNGNFPRKISDQKYNEYIKEVCEKAQINDIVFAPKYRQPVIVNNKKVYRKIVGHFPKHEVITSHVGRRTFVSLFINNIDLESIRKITGHGQDKMIAIYNKLNSLERAEFTKAKFKDAGFQ